MFLTRKPKKIIAVVLYPGMTALDVVGTMETLMGVNLGRTYRLLTVGETIEPIQTDTSLKLIPNHTFPEVPTPYCLIVPGGEAAMTAVENDALRGYIRSAGKSADVLASIGTGSLILAANGFLDGRKATTHWRHARQLEDLGATYVRQRWVEDGNVITAAGTTAGIDMALHLLSRLTSVSAARRMQLIIEYDPQPPFGGIDRDLMHTGQSSPVAQERLS
jgi:transcriptional regulator GlxA family with amidase domain